MLEQIVGEATSQSSDGEWSSQLVQERGFCPTSDTNLLVFDINSPFVIGIIQELQWTADELDTFSVASSVSYPGRSLIFDSREFGDNPLISLGLPVYLWVWSSKLYWFTRSTHMFLFIENRSLSSQDPRQISTTVCPRSDWTRPLWDIRTLPTFQQISASPTRASGAAAWLLQRRNPWDPQQWEYLFNYNVLYLLGKFNNVIKMREFLIKLSEIDSDWPSLLGESFVFN